MSSAFSLNCLATKVEVLKSMFLVTLGSRSISVATEYSSCTIFWLSIVLCKSVCFLWSISSVSDWSVSVLTISSPSPSFWVSFLITNSSFSIWSLSSVSEWSGSKLSFFLSSLWYFPSDSSLFVSWSLSVWTISS